MIGLRRLIDWISDLYSDPLFFKEINPNFGENNKQLYIYYKKNKKKI